MYRSRLVALLLLPCLSLLSGACGPAQPTSTPAAPTRRATAPRPTLPPLELTVLGRGLLDGEPCRPPCWEGITPGRSSEAELVRILDHLLTQGLIDEYKVYTKEEGKALYDALYWVVFPRGWSQVVIEEGQVDHIGLFADDYVVFDYRVEQAIGQFGEPEAYASRFTGEVACSCEWWDDTETFATPGAGLPLLLYPAQGVTVECESPVSYAGCVCPRMRVIYFWYYSPMSLTEVMGCGTGIPATARRELDRDDFVEWHGYGPGY